MQYSPLPALRRRRIGRPASRTPKKRLRTGLRSLASRSGRSQCSGAASLRAPTLRLVAGAAPTSLTSGASPGGSTQPRRPSSARSSAIKPSRACRKGLLGDRTLSMASAWYRRQAQRTLGV
jgi:hypothetical protein